MILIIIIGYDAIGNYDRVDAASGYVVDSYFDAHYAGLACVFGFE